MSASHTSVAPLLWGLMTVSLTPRGSVWSSMALSLHRRKRTACQHHAHFHDTLVNVGDTDMDGHWHVNGFAMDWYPGSGCVSANWHGYRGLALELLYPRMVLMCLGSYGRRGGPCTVVKKNRELWACCSLGGAVRSNEKWQRGGCLLCHHA